MHSKVIWSTVRTFLISLAVIGLVIYCGAVEDIFKKLPVSSLVVFSGLLALLSCFAKTVFEVLSELNTFKK